MTGFVLVTASGLYATYNIGAGFSLVRNPGAAYCYPDEASALAAAPHFAAALGEPVNPEPLP